MFSSEVYSRRYELQNTSAWLGDKGVGYTFFEFLEDAQARRPSLKTIKISSPFAGGKLFCDLRDRLAAKTVQLVRRNPAEERKEMLGPMGWIAEWMNAKERADVQKEWELFVWVDEERSRLDEAEMHGNPEPKSRTEVVFDVADAMHCLFLE
jgi:hypothetical protein